MKLRTVVGWSAVVLATLLMFAAEANPAAGAAGMDPSKSIMQNLANSHDHTTFVEILKTSGLADRLDDPGPFTVLAPSNAAFAKAPTDKLTQWKRHEYWEETGRTFLYYVLPGKLTAADIQKMIEDGGGKAELDTENGGVLIATLSAGKIKLQDEKGGTATITTKDLNQSNGIVQVIDSVLMPKFPR